MAKTYEDCGGYKKPIITREEFQKAIKQAEKKKNERNDSNKKK